MLIYCNWTKNDNLLRYDPSPEERKGKLSEWNITIECTHVIIKRQTTHDSKVTLLIPTITGMYNLF